MPWVRLWIERRAAARARVERDAAQLMIFLGDMAYAEARSRARACRGRGDPANNRHWGRVAVTIAHRTGHAIGLQAADRYAQDARGDDPAQVAARQAARVTVPILELLREVALGQITPTSLHNLEAAVWSAVATASHVAAVRTAGDEVRRAAAALVTDADSATASIAAGVYAPALLVAGDAVERLRAALAGAHGSAGGRWPSLSRWSLARRA